MQKKLKKYSVLALISTCIIIGFIGILYFYKFFTFIGTPLNSNSNEKLFSILPGQNLAAISIQLESESIISSSRYFKLYARIKKAGKKLKAGEYLLSASNTPAQILEIFLKGRVKLYKIMIPEGWNLKQISREIENSGFCDASFFLTLCHDKDFITSLNIKSISLEGYLFPDTYFFPKHTSCENIIQTMTDHFKKSFTPAMIHRAEELGFSIHEIVTLASIVEKETGTASERPLISSVFHNRLKKDMRLETDPTVIYGIENFDGNIKREHLQILTPYNTYKIKGLPIGPIASPGILALQAALYPARSDYLFFVSKKDTTHKFSKTYEEHNEAVRKYQLGK
ncbi:MAG: endolytic transglycosylase MltG [Proteobacteria bacterium]|nr:endolytic transglycosylase MltG [Pseudomonadota bacterium]MBU1387843.1 endolytic transglycosylase MltG [Pseudomonadota bacterium]MBU1543220.1 endolytic transglycosylase MltG [Pseudomonadota bacterium]MBU2482453.1 endolytic transglycosylase MltG [Pseudomonadota bacterium]